MADKEKGKGKFLPRRKSLNEAVQVLVRCRPMSEKEVTNEYLRVVDVDPTCGTIEIQNPKSEQKDAKKVFTFDAVFDWNAGQEDVYEAVRPLVSSVLSGFNGTIFAYGQTGAGKTYTMEGCVSDSSKRGIILRAFDQIFTHISRSKDQQFLVRTSYLEIYQEDIRDLLAAHGKCEIRERTDSGVYIKDLSSFVCKDATEITNVMNLGNVNRSIGATNMNEHSSRSHAILTVTVEMVDLNTGEGSERAIRVGKLNLVDLAGSERQSKSGAKGDRLKEASKINLSLSALGNVISALVDGRTSHVPYRDSKLTRLLQDSLGGNSKTIMVANIGPASYNYEESLTTLRYAQRAKCIKNKPKVNEDPKDALLREYREEIARLKDLLAETALKKKKILSNVDTNMFITNDQRGDVDNKSSEISEQERKQLEEIERHKKEIAEDKKLTEELEQKIASMESKLLCGGKNIIDHTNEQQRALELRIQEIAETKLTEVMMRQQLELQEDMVLNIHSSYSSLQHEVEVKTKKLKKLFSKLQDVKQEVRDLTEEFNRDRRDLELTQNELLKEIKKKNMIIENFIPLEHKSQVFKRLIFSEEEDDWVLQPNREEDILATKRPVALFDRRPIPFYGHYMSLAYRYQSENILILSLDPDIPVRTTQDYAIPVIAPKILAVLDQALRTEEDLDIDASKLTHSSRPERRSGVKRSGVVTQHRSEVASTSSNLTLGKAMVKEASDIISPNKFKSDPVYPKARGLVPKK